MSELTVERRWSFSLLTLIVFVTLAAVAIYLFVAAPAEVYVPVLLALSVLFPCVLLGAIVCGQGTMRAFAAGAFCPAFIYCQSSFNGALAYVFAVSDSYLLSNSRNYQIHLSGQSQSIRAATAATLAFSLLGGLLVVFLARRWQRP